MRVGRAPVRALSLGPLRHPRPPAELPVRRHGEPAADLRDADGARRRPQPRLADRPRARPLLVGQPGHQRHLERLLAQRGLHDLPRAAHRRGRLRTATSPRWRRCSAARTSRTRSTGCEDRDEILHIDLSGRDPDDGATRLPYEKGCLFLRSLEELYGRARFDEFLRGYFDHFAFQSITTADFVAYLTENLLLEGHAFSPRRSRSKKWIRVPGLPEEAPRAVSTRLQEAGRVAGAWNAGTVRARRRARSAAGGRRSASLSCGASRRRCPWLAWRARRGLRADG